MFNSQILLLVSLIIYIGSLLPTANFRRIRGGRLAELGEFPIVAKISRPNGARFCGGVIITQRAILTAAHCFACEPINHCPKDRIVLVGDILLSKKKRPPKSRQVFKTHGVIIHKSFKRPDYTYDIAIVPLPKRIIFSKNVQPARLPTQDSNFEIGTKCAIAGWGSTSREKRDLSLNLLATAIRIQDPHNCEQTLKGYFASEWMICAGDLTGVNDSCTGDSGGPLICKDELAGLVSIGNCSMSGGYTSILTHLNWIKRKLHEYRLENRGNWRLINAFYVLLFGQVLSLIIFKGSGF